MFCPGDAVHVAAVDVRQIDTAITISIRVEGNVPTIGRWLNVVVLRAVVHDCPGRDPALPAGVNISALCASVLRPVWKNSMLPSGAKAGENCGPRAPRRRVSTVARVVGVVDGTRPPGLRGGRRRGVGRYDGRLFTATASSRQQAVVAELLPRLP